jgi:HEAT repeat protein
VLDEGKSVSAVARDLDLTASADNVTMAKALEALAQAGVQGHTADFKRACQDADSQVRAAALAALGNLKDRSLIEFYRGLFRKDPSYRVQAEALTAIGKTGDPTAAPFLRQAAAVPSYRNMVRRAAEAALKLVERK